MDFSFSDEQQAILDLARQIFADFVDHERLKQLELTLGGANQQLAKLDSLLVSQPRTEA